MLPFHTVVFKEFGLGCAETQPEDRTVAHSELITGPETLERQGAEPSRDTLVNVRPRFTTIKSVIAAATLAYIK